MREIQAVIRQQAGSIECNFEQVEQAIQERLDEYRDAVFTEESRTVARKEIAGLRAEQKKLKDRLRDAKKIYMEPWDAFEERAKSLIALYNEPVALIDGQVKAFEEKRIAERKQLIRHIYQETAAGLQEYIPLEKIYNPRWENATTREKAIREEMEKIAAGTGQALETIQEMHSEASEEALRIYKKNLSLPDAVSCINRYEIQKQEILKREWERKRLEEEERIRREERERLELEKRAREEKETALRRAEEEKAAELRLAEKKKAEEMARVREEAAQEVVDSLIPEFSGETRMYEYRMDLTADAREKLELYLDSVGITYEVEEITGW